MKTKEFIERVERLGISVMVSPDGVTPFNRLGHNIATVSSKERWIFDIDCFGLSNLTKVKQNKLFNLLVEYASTPLEDREDHEKEYYIKHKYFSDENGYLNYLGNEDEDEPEEEKWFLSNIEPEVEMGILKISFTLEELPDWVHKMIEDGYMIKEEVK